MTFSSPPLDLILDSVDARRSGKIGESDCLDEIERVALVAKKTATHPPSVQRDELLARAKSYLGNGGLFNPEMMDHEEVRQLLTDLAVYIDDQDWKALYERAEDMLLRVEWTRQSAGSKYACPFCHCISVRDDGPGHAPDCEWSALVVGRRASSGWRSIDSAPRDGTEILLYENGQMENGSWEFIETSEWDGLQCYGWCTDSGRIENPTHWREALPAPPEEVAA